MKNKILLILLALISIGWMDDGWIDDYNLNHIVIKEPFVLTKTHYATGGLVSGDSIELSSVPAKSILQYIIIDAEAPTMSGSGGYAVNFAVGSAANTDNDLTDATDYDYLVATGLKTTANVAGDLTADYDGTKFATTKKSESYYVATDTELYLNYLLTGDTGSVTTITGDVFIIYDLIQ